MLLASLNIQLHENQVDICVGDIINIYLYYIDLF